LYYFAASLIGYLFGCIQTAYIVGQLKGRKDIRKLGTNNAGASNVTTVFGWKYGVLTGLVDILKGTFAVLLIGRLFPGYTDLKFLAGTFVIVGHIFPFFLGFKGGKGTASLVGICIGLNFKIAVILSLALIIITIITDYIALGSLAMYTLFPILAVVYKFSVIALICLIVLCIIGYYKHRINIKRILAHEEIGLRKVAKTKG
jgi:glycerol-3-phosphate acyltransferase PlsY